MKKEKVSFFEVAKKTGKCLSWALGLYLLFEGIVEIGDFIGLAKVSSGPIAYAISRLTQSSVGHILFLLANTGLLVFIYEWFRRSLSKHKSMLSYVVLAIMTLMVCDFLVSLAPDSSQNILQQIQNPSRFDSFAVRFRNISAAFQSILSLILSLGMMIKYKGRLAAYGWVNLACMIVSGVGMGYLYMFLYNHNINFMNQGLAFAWVLFRYIVGVLPVLFLRRTLVHKDILQADNQNDI